MFSVLLMVLSPDVLIARSGQPSVAEREKANAASCVQ
jgi:hypothetical protein